jgi:hypothetical protein
MVKGVFFMKKLLNSKLIGLVIKRISKVEADTNKSNQHEFNGNRDLRKLLGDLRLSNKTVTFSYYNDTDGEVSNPGTITWYDAREAHPNRSEYRLYFKSNPVMDLAEPGDLLIVSLDDDGELNIIIIQEGSQIEENLLKLFGPFDNIGTSFEYKILD